MDQTDQMGRTDAGTEARTEARTGMQAGPQRPATLPPATALRDASAAGPAMRSAIGPDPAIVDPAEHNVVFTSLVTGDGDIVGLVAYSIYKQNKYDWLDAYSRLEGRMPEPAEVHSYLLGESTARRLATYRHLAQAVLDGRGPDVPGAAGGPSGSASASPLSAPRSTTQGADPAAPARRAEPARAAPPPRIGIARGRSTFQLSSRAIVALCVALVVLVALFWLMRSGAPLPPQTPAK